MKRITIAGLLLGITGPATADCYDVFGCSDSNLFRLRDLLNGPTCEFLYVMRNSIFKQHGYCFKTARGIATFGNQGCVSGNPNALGLNGIERANAGTILRAEQTLGCPE